MRSENIAKIRPKLCKIVTILQS